MKKLGKFNLIEENICKLKHCKCGWNITIGGKDIKDLKEIKRFIGSYSHTHKPKKTTIPA